MLSARFVALSLSMCFLIPASVVARPGTSVPQLASIPANAATLAYDEERGVTIAYDVNRHILGELVESGPVLVRREAGTCANVNVDDIKRLDGFNLLTDYAKTNWGDGWAELMANPSDWPDRGANACISGDITQITIDGDPNCVTQSQSTDGTLVGANGTVALSAMQGTSSSTQVTVTKQAQIAVGASISAKVSVPLIAEVTATATTTVTITNTLSTANTFTVNNQVTQSLTITSKAGQTCHLDFNVQSCNANGHGSQKMTTHGWLWFRYKNKRDGHWYWAVNMDTIIPNEDQRSAYIEFQTSTSSNTQSSYHAVCEGGPEETTPPPPPPPPPSSTEPAPEPTTSSPVETEPPVTETTTPATETTSTAVPTETAVPSTETAVPSTETAVPSTEAPVPTTEAPVPNTTEASVPVETTVTSTDAPTETAVPTTSTDAPATTGTALPPTPSDCVPELRNGMTITQNGETFIVFKMVQ